MPQPRRRRHGTPARPPPRGSSCCQQEGCTEALMLAHGFSIDMMVEPLNARLSSI